MPEVTTLTTTPMIIKVMLMTGAVKIYQHTVQALTSTYNHCFTHVTKVQSPQPRVANML